MTLDEYIDAAERKPWRWGLMDCCVFGADWVLNATGKDPIIHYREQYATAGNAKRLIKRGGGLLKLMEAEMIRCGFQETSHADHGDVGIVPIPSMPEHAVADAAIVIKHGPWWVGRTSHGIAGFNAPVLKAWRIPFAPAA